MTSFDAKQLDVLALDPGKHARIIGAPGSGKTTLLVETYARLLQEEGWKPEQMVVLTSGRLQARHLRDALEARASRVLTGTLARTPVSFAYALLAFDATLSGRAVPRLITGAAHDEVMGAVVAEARTQMTSEVFLPEVLESERFRTELREFSRAIDHSGLPMKVINERLSKLHGQSAQSAAYSGPEPQLLARWQVASRLVARVNDELSNSFSGDVTASGMLRQAAELVRRGAIHTDAIPRLILVDDAQNLREGDLALLAACAERGSAVWVFGDPDVAAGAFRGDRPAILRSLNRELERRSNASVREEAAVVLQTVYRHDAGLRNLVTKITSRIGADGLGQQRTALSAIETADSRVTFAKVASPSEAMGALAYRLKAWRLGVDRAERTDWSRMAVICRSRHEAELCVRQLAHRDIPVGDDAGGVVLKKHRVVQDLVTLLRDALCLKPITEKSIASLLSGPISGTDVITLRRLRRALLIEERRFGGTPGQQSQSIDSMLLEGVLFPGDRPIIDSAGGRAVQRLGRIVQAGREAHARGASARETLWAIWEAAGVAERLQSAALDGSDDRAETADRMLDAVVALFFSLQRHEEQASDRPIAELLDEILTSQVAADTIAATSVRDRVTVTTAEAAIGRQFDRVIVFGPQEGVWPNLRTQGALLGVTAFERWLTGGEALMPTRSETLHDELRLFALASSRAETELLVLSISDDDQHPGPFFALGSEFMAQEAVPSSELTLRGAVGEMRRRLTANPSDSVARDSLVRLTQENVDGAHPERWYGLIEPSTHAPLVDLESSEDAHVSASPSDLERVEECALSWVLTKLGAGTPNTLAELGTLIHRVFEIAPDAEADELEQLMLRNWEKLRFDSQWESERAQRTGLAMIEGIRAYVHAGENRRVDVAASEVRFQVDVGRARLRGTVDRIELQEHDDGTATISIVDLKTTRQKPSAARIEIHAQLQAYQLGVLLGGFEDIAPEGGGEMRNGGAKLVFVHPDAVGRGGYVETPQQPLDAAVRDEVITRISRIAETLAAAQFTAQVEHHCTSKYSYGECKLHIIPAVSAS